MRNLLLIVLTIALFIENQLLAQDSTYIWTCGNSISNLYNSDEHYNQFEDPWPYSNSNPPVPIFLEKKQWVSIASVGAIVSAVAADGTLWQWATNTNSARSPVPGQATSQTNCKQVAYGSGSTVLFILKNDGTIWRGASGSTQVSVQGDVWNKISTTSTSLFALKSDSTVWRWSVNSQGVLSNMTQLGPGAKWIDLATIPGTAYGIRDDGTLWELFTSLQSFHQEGTDSDWKKIFGKRAIFAIKNNGSLWVLGNTNTYGQLGIGNNSAASDLTQVGTDSNWDMVFPGIDHCFGLKTNGSLFSWGRNQFYQLGIANNIDQTSPVQVGATGEWRLAEAGDNISVLFRTWGYDGNTSTPSIPAAPSNLTATPTNSIELNWQDNSNNEDGFHVESATDANGPWSIIYTTAANETSYLHTGLTNGVEYFYRVKAFNANGESAYSNTASAIEGIVGIAEAKMLQQIVFPNPAKEVVYIYTPEKASVEVTDVAGKVVFRTISANNQKISFDVSNLLNGIYFVHTKHNNNSHIQKLLVIK